MSLNLIKKLEYKDKSRRYFGLYECSFCGKQKKIRINSVKNENVQSCGCLQKSKAKNNIIKLNTTHGLSKIPEYKIWGAIKRRCYNKNDNSYYNYGSRNIFVCKEWINSFDKFYIDMGPRPSKYHSIERLNNDEGYYKENCVWVDRKTQNNNKRNNIYITYLGQTKTLSQWSEIIGIPYQTLFSRVRRKWDHEKTITTTIRKKMNSNENK